MGDVARTPVQALTDDPSDIARIARRYPPRTLGPLVKALIALAVVLGLAWYLQMAVRNSQRPPVEATLTAHWVVDAQQAGFELLVARPDPSRPAICTVRAQAQNYEHIGDTEVEIPPSDQDQVTITGTLRTVRVADALYVEGCRLVD